MAKGQKIDELYISLGLDINQLQLDFDVAGRTVQQTISRLNSENNRIKLQTDIDMSKLEGTGSELDKIRVKYEAINRQLDIQRQKQELLNAVAKDARNQYGADSGLTRRADTNVLYQQRAIAQMEAEARRLNAQIQPQKVNALDGYNGIKGKLAEAQSSILNFTGSTDGAITESLSLLARVPTAYGKIAVAAVAMGATIPIVEMGLIKIAEPSIKAGANIYKMSQRMHTSTSDAAQFSRIFRLAGVDIDAGAAAVTRLDKSLQTAGAKGNEASLTLQRYGISLRDANGNLLPMNEQIEKLADGYKKAAVEGRAEDFAVATLGARGREIIPVLEEYTGLKERSSKIKNNGLIDPKAAKDADDELRVMNEQIGQLKTASSAVFIPIATNLIPEMTKKFQILIEVIQKVKNGFNSIGKLQNGNKPINSFKDFMSAKSVSSELIDGLLKGPHQVGDYWKDEYEKYKQNQQKIVETATQTENTLRQLKGDTTNKVIDDNDKQQASEMELQQSRDRAAKNSQEAESILYRMSHTATESQIHDIENWKKSAIEQSKTEEEKASVIQLAEAKIKQALDESAKAAAKATQEAQEASFSATHNDYDNSIHSIEKRAQEWRNAGADETAVAQAVADQRAKIDKEAAEKRAEFENEVESQIDSVWKSGLQSRLDGIDREQRAWVKKGLDEVKATEWAEHEKQRIRNESVASMFKEQKKYLDIYRQAMAGKISGFDGGGVQVFDFDASPEKRMAAAKAGIMALMRKEAGISDGEFTTPGEIAGFQNVMKMVQDSPIVPILSDEQRDAMPQMINMNNGQQYLHGAIPSTPIENNITVNYNDAYVDSPERQYETANQTAKIILDNTQGGWNKFGE